MCSTCGRSPWTSCSWVSAEELPVRQGAARRKYHTGLRRVWDKHGSVTDSFATAGNLHTSRFLLEIEGAAPALVSVSCTLGRAALGSGLVQHPVQQQLQ